MIRLFKCFFGLGCMFLALVAPQAYHMGAGSVFNGMAIGVKTLWIPTTWATFYGVILGGLIFAYQHRALSPWLSFFSDPARVDTKDIECALRILETTQKLVLCTGIILGMMGCIACEPGSGDPSISAYVRDRSKPFCHCRFVGPLPGHTVSLLLVQSPQR